MKVLHVRSQYVVDGGVETFLVALISHLTAAGTSHPVAVLTTSDVQRPSFHSRIPAHAQAACEGIAWDKGRFLAPTVRRVAAMMERERADVLHTHDNRANIVGLVLRRWQRRPTPWIASAHGWVDKPLKSRLIGQIDKNLIRHADRVHFASRLLFKQIRPLPEGRLAAIPYFLEHQDASEYSRDALRAQWHIPDDHCVLGMVGRLSIEKGHTYLLQAMKQILASCPRTTLLIVGDGPLKPSLEAQARELGIEGDVVFAGFYRDAVEACSIFDIFISSSLHETISMVQLEALHLGKPVVATTVGANSEVIEAGTNGLLVPSTNSDALARAAVELLRDPVRRAQYGAASRKLFDQRFQASVLTPQYLRLYEEAIAQS